MEFRDNVPIRSDHQITRTCMDVGGLIQVLGFDGGAWQDVEYACFMTREPGQAKACGVHMHNATDK